jgi:branched-chain amino acid transport system permease protein
VAKTERHPDRDLEVAHRYDAWIRPRLRALVTEELIAEHERNPLGQHSDALERVLNYFRRAPVGDKYAIVCTRPDREWRICTLNGRRGEPLPVVGDEVFDSELAAHHGVFLRRVRDLERD